MTSPPAPKDSPIGKGISYLFALVLTTVIASQSVNLQFKINRAGEYEWAIASRELNAQIFYPCVGLIAAILKLPTDTIALALGQFLSKGRE
ncbi:hypothetical protein LC607_17795 [Nostoc sp. CHAB 5824]|nr:hypothetical protein [Nostoc sp. CHAB 5824]